MSEPAATSPGRLLSEARKAQALSIVDLRQRTSLMEFTITLLERDKPHALPSAPMARYHYALCAQALGINKHRMGQACDAWCIKRASEHPYDSGLDYQPLDLTPKPGASTRLTLPIAVILAGIGMFGLWLLLRPA